MRYYISPPPMNPIARLVTAIMAVLVLVSAFFFGLVVLFILALVFFLLGLIYYLRSWWLRRTIGDTEVTQSRTVADGTVIDAEYTVISRRRN